MTYQCPKCDRYGMEWDGRAKIILCYYNTCNHVIRMENQKNTPSPEAILKVIQKDSLGNTTEHPNNLVST